MNNSNQSSTPLSAKRNKLIVAIGVFAFLGFADSVYLTISHYFALQLPCSILHGCEEVLSSPYSMVGPIPLAAFGVAFYLFALFVAIHLYTSAPSRRYDAGLFALTAIGFGMSGVFEGIQAFIIHAFCEYCAFSALLSTLMFFCGVWLVWLSHGVRPSES